MTAKTGTLNAARSVRADSAQAWAIAIRPASLPVAISPVLVGATLGFVRTGAIDLLAALLVLGAALLMQAITNMQNDVGYTVRGGEANGTRIGLPRATSNGWLSVRHVRQGIIFASVMAIGFGLGLVAYRGWPVLLIGSIGMVSVLAAAIGGLAAAALAVNNHRDIAHDRSTGRHTFAVCYGESASQWLYSVLLLGPFALVPVMALVADDAALLLALLLLPAAWMLRRDFIASGPGHAYNLILFRTFRLELCFAALLSVAALLGRLLL